LFPLIPLPIIEAILGAKIQRDSLEIVSINSTSNNRSDFPATGGFMGTSPVFPLIPLPIIEAI